MRNIQYFEYQPWVVTGTDRFSLGFWITLWKISKAYPETKFECGWQSQSFRNFEIWIPTSWLMAGVTCAPLRTVRVLVANVTRLRRGMLSLSWAQQSTKRLRCRGLKGNLKVLVLVLSTSRCIALNRVQQDA